MAWVATRRGFSIASLVAQPLELSCGFNTISTYSSHQHLLRGDSEACVHTGQEAFKGFVKAGWVEGAQASLLMWVPYHFPWRQDWRVGKGDVKWPHLYTHTHTDDTLHLWWCELLAQTFLVVELFSPFPSGCLFTANSCLLPGLLSKSHFPAPIPCCTWRRKTQAGVCRAAAKSIHLGLTLSCLSQTSYCIPV